MFIYISIDMIGGEYTSYEGGSVQVYTGPRKGKFVINKKGKNEITKFFKAISEIIFIVVSENIIKNKPRLKVITLIRE